MSDPLENTQVTENLLENGGEGITRTATAGEREQMQAEFRQYLQALKRSPATLAGYQLGLKRFFAWLDTRGVAALRSVTRADLESWQAWLVESGRYTTHSIHVLLRAVRRFYDYQERNGRVLVNPTRSMIFPKLEDRLPRTVLTVAEMKKLLDAPDTSQLDGIRDKAMLELFYSTGLRLAELCSLTVYDVDCNSGYVRVHCGKGGKDRVVPMGHKATQYVKEYLHHVRGRFTQKRRDERTLFVGKQWGKPIHPLVVERLIKCYAAAAGIGKRVTPHVFRHTCATHLLAEGADLVHIQRLLGHACINTTQIYTRVARREVKQTHGKTHPRERDHEAIPRKLPGRMKGPYRKASA